MIKAKRGRLVPKGKKPSKTQPRGKQRASRGKEKSISKLIKEADALFSKEVRSLQATTVTSTGDVYETEPHNWCFTCNKRYPIKKLHCGHYLSRYYKAARWNYDNARPQCMMCNMWKRGDLIVFRRNLISEIGEARVLDVEKLRDAPIKLSREYLGNLIKTLSQ